MTKQEGNYRVISILIESMRELGVEESTIESILLDIGIGSWYKRNVEKVSLTDQSGRQLPEEETMNTTINNTTPTTNNTANNEPGFFSKAAEWTKQQAAAHKGKLAFSAGVASTVALAYAAKAYQDHKASASETLEVSES